MRIISQRRGVLALILGLLLTLAVAFAVMILIAVPNMRQGSRILTPDGERVVRRAKEKPLAAAGTTRRTLAALRWLLAGAARRIGQAWRPVSAALHEAFDRLEGRERRDAGGTSSVLPAAGRDEVPEPARLPGPAPVTEPLPVVEPAWEAEAPRVAERAPAADPSRVAEPAPVTRPAPVSQPAPVAPPAPVTQPVAQPAFAGPLQARFDLDRVGFGRSRVGRPRSIPAISGPIPEITPDQVPRVPATSDRQVIDLRSTEPEDRETGEQVSAARRPS